MVLAHTDTGRGPVIVLLHGWSLDRRTWKPQEELLRQRGFRVIAPDLPGHGESVAYSNGHSPATFSAMPAALLELLDSLDVEKAILCGLSMGSALAVEFTIAHPDRVVGLLLASNAMADGANRGSASAQRLREHGLDALVPMYAPLLFSARWRIERTSAVKEWAREFRSNDVESLATVVSDYHGRRRWGSELHSITVPTSVVFGSEDATTSIDRRSDYLTIPGSIRDDIAGVGHLANVEAPVQFTERILRLADRVPTHSPVRRAPIASMAADPGYLSSAYLYVPADSVRKLASAAQSQAQALILDLEDGVAPSAKDTAVKGAREFLMAGHSAECWVRLDPSRWHADLGVLIASGCQTLRLRGVIVPKAESGAGIAAVSERLAELEGAAGLVVGSIAIIPLIETPLALDSLPELARAPRVLRFGMGEADLRAALGLRATVQGFELLTARSAVVLASAAAGLAPPIASTSTDFTDLEALAESSGRLRSLGFTARTAIHPAQLPAILRAFEPTPEELAQARKTLDAFESAIATDRGAVASDGVMIDLAVVRTARDLLAQAQRK